MTQISQKKEIYPKNGILTKKSKIFIKAKFTVSKSCLLGPTCFINFCILGDAHLQKLSFLRGPSIEFFFSTFPTLPHIPESLGIKIRNCLFFWNYFQKIAIVKNTRVKIKSYYQSPSICVLYDYRLVIDFNFDLHL